MQRRQLRAVVHFLDAVNHRATLQRDLAGGGGHPRIGIDPLHRHGQIKRDPITRLPPPAQSHIAPHVVDDLSGTVQAQARCATPTRQPQGQREFRRGLRLDHQFHPVLPRIFRLHLQPDGPAPAREPHLAAGIEMDGETVRGLRIRVIAE